MTFWDRFLSVVAFATMFAATQSASPAKPDSQASPPRGFGNGLYLPVASANTDSDGLVCTAIVADDARSVRIAFADGRTTTIATDDIRESFGSPRIASDGHLVGWSDRRTEGASYAYPVALHFISDGRAQTVACASGFPWGWRFASPGRVGLRCEPLHGVGAHSLQLVEIATGKIVDRIVLTGDDDELPRAAPAWSHGTFAP